MGWRGRWQNLGDNLFLYNHGTKNDLHTFEVFQRTRIEEDDGGAADLSLQGLSQSSLLTSVRIRERLESWPGSSQRKWRC